MYFQKYKMKKVLISLLTIGLAVTTKAQIPTKSADGMYNLNLDSSGCILQGYDVVAMFIMPEKTIKGNQQFESTYDGAKYWFASVENKATFDSNPAKYKVYYGGYCSIAVSEGNLRPTLVWTHEIVDGKLVVNHNAKAKALWDRNPEKNLKKAEKKWPELNKKEAKYDILKKRETQESLAATSYGENK